MLLKDLALGVVANGAGLDEAAQVELLCPEHGHDGNRRPTLWEFGLTRVGDIEISGSGESLMMPAGSGGI